MKKLDKRIKCNGFYYDLIKRTDRKAMYQSDSGFYEVFIIRIQEANEGTFEGVIVIFEHKELFPKNEDFGSTAWCYSTGRNKMTAFDLAEQKYELLPE